MLESLYNQAIEKKGKINQQITKYDIDHIDVSSFWKSEEIPKSSEDFLIGAGDGSLNKKKFLSFNFYAIAVESLIYGNKKTNNGPVKVENSEINTISHSKFVDDRLRNYMGIFEVKSALKVINEFDLDYYLYDGSILGDLIRPYPFEKKIPQDIRFELLDLLEDDYNKEIISGNVEIATSKIIKNNDIEDKIKELSKYNPLLYLEYIEKLLSLYHLLNHKEKIIAISKTSTANDFFDINIPDIAIFDKHDKKTGYSKVCIKPIDSDKSLKREFPIQNDFFKKLTFTIFYLRLEENKNILKIELPYKANENRIKEIISIIAKNSIEGYPYLLKKAHHDVIIKKKDIEQLSKIVGFYEKTGREML